MCAAPSRQAALAELGLAQELEKEYRLQTMTPPPSLTWPYPYSLYNDSEVLTARCYHIHTLAPGAPTFIVKC